MAWLAMAFDGSGETSTEPWVTVTAVRCGSVQMLKWVPVTRTSLLSVRITKGRCTLRCTSKYASPSVRLTLRRSV
ncbi:hypothetical protein D3C76_1067680 [compost metagenome]